MESIKKNTARGVLLYTLCIFMAQWILASVHSAVGAYQTAVIGAYALEDSAKGLVSSTLSLLTIITFAAVMFLSGRARKSRILLFGLALAACSLCLITVNGVERSYGLLLFLIAFAGIGCGCIDSLGSAVLSELYPGKGSVMSLYHATYGCAGLMMPFVFQLLNGQGVFGSLGFRGAYAFVGALALVPLAVMAAGVLPAYAENAQDPNKRASLGLLKQTLSEKRLLPVFVSAILGGMYLNTMLVWTPRFIVYGHGGAAYEKWALACVYLAITLSRLLMSILKPNMRKTLWLLMPFSALGLLAAIWVKQPLWALVCVFVSVFCCAPVIPFQVTIASDMRPQNRFLITLALMFIMMLGQTLIAPVIGAAESAWGINSAMYIAAGAMALSWTAALKIK